MFWSASAGSAASDSCASGLLLTEGYGVGLWLDVAATPAKDNALPPKTIPIASQTARVLMFFSTETLPNSLFDEYSVLSHRLDTGTESSYSGPRS